MVCWDGGWSVGWGGGGGVWGGWVVVVCGRCVCGGGVGAAAAAVCEVCVGGVMVVMVRVGG